LSDDHNAPPSGPFAQHRLLVDSFERGQVEAFLRQHQIVDLRSYRFFLQEVAIQTAVGRIPPETASVLKSLAEDIFKAMETEAANAAAAAALESEGVVNLLPLPSPGRQITAVEDMEPHYSTHPKPVVLEAPDDAVAAAD